MSQVSDAFSGGSSGASDATGASAFGDTPNLTNSDFAGLTDADIMGGGSGSGGFSSFSNIMNALSGGGSGAASSTGSQAAAMSPARRPPTRTKGAAGAGAARRPSKTTASTPRRRPSPSCEPCSRGCPVSRRVQPGKYRKPLRFLLSARLPEARPPKPDCRQWRPAKPARNRPAPALASPVRSPEAGRTFRRRSQPPGRQPPTRPCLRRDLKTASKSAHSATIPQAIKLNLAVASGATAQSRPSPCPQRRLCPSRRTSPAKSHPAGLPFRPTNRRNRKPSRLRPHPRQRQRQRRRQPRRGSFRTSPGPRPAVRPRSPIWRRSSCPFCRCCWAASWAAAAGAAVTSGAAASAASAAIAAA